VDVFWREAELKYWAESILEQKKSVAARKIFSQDTGLDIGLAHTFVT